MASGPATRFRRIRAAMRRAAHGALRRFRRPSQQEDPGDKLYREVVNSIVGTRSHMTYAEWCAQCFLCRPASAIQAQWQEEFHLETFLPKFPRRCAQFGASIVLETSIEVAIMLYVANQPLPPDRSEVLNALYSYILFRVPSVVFLTVLPFYLVRKYTMDMPVQTQGVVVVCTCIGLVLLMMSYDRALSALPVEFGFVTSQIPVFVFFIMTMLTWRMHPFVFGSYLCIIPTSIFMMCILDYELWGCSQKHLSNLGTMFFVLNSVITSAFKFSQERELRIRFKANYAAEWIQERTEQILYTLMPPLVVEAVRLEGMSLAAPPSHLFRKATVVQSDLCGFTNFCSRLTPVEVIGYVEQIFGLFDELTDKYDVYKVETVGDAYIAGLGEWPLTSDDSVNEPFKVVLLGLGMVEATRQWSDKIGGLPIGCRVGVSHGECIGGLVGIDMQRYHLFGHLIEEVAVLEATGKEGIVHVSTACKNAVDESRWRGCNAASQEQEAEISFWLRTDELVTSKGEQHSSEEVGGETYLVHLKNPSMFGREVMRMTSQDTCGSTPSRARDAR